MLVWGERERERLGVPYSVGKEEKEEEAASFLSYFILPYHSLFNLFFCLSSFFVYGGSERGERG